jgi:hypothetical protein
MQALMQAVYNACDGVPGKLVNVVVGFKNRNRN